MDKIGRTPPNWQFISKLKLICLTLFLLTMLNACNKEQLPIEVPEDSVTSAKSFFEKQAAIRQVSLEGHSFLPDTMLRQRKLLWDKAFEQLNSDTTIVFVPIALPSTLYLKVGGVENTYLNDLIWLRIMDVGNGFENAEMITLVPNKEWYTGEAFSGIIFTENWFSPQVRYVQTADVAKRINNRGKGSATDNKLSDRNTEPGRCVLVQYYSCVSAGGYTNCTVNSYFSCGAGGGGGGGTPSRPPGGGGGGGGSSNVNNSEIHNDLSDPCLSELMDELLDQKDLENRLIDILKQFDADKAVAFDYVDGTSLSDDFLGYYNPVASDDTRRQIELNSKLLPKASKETATVVILHESVHAYMAWKGKADELHHGQMAATYTGLLAQALVDLYGTSREIADKLAWQGLQSTDAYGLYKKSLTQEELNDLEKTLTDYRDGNTGTKFCN